ncbi:MAG: GPI inositol-deacylase [Rhodocyclaceae bacterium]|nr:GPI inositol-deacylase [Rhodocyclaceae bacterium]
MNGRHMHNTHHWYEFDLLQSPGLVRLALEWRAPWEFGASIAAKPLLSLAPKGDGHPVLVFPGLIAPDMSTLPLRRFLKGRGYAAAPLEAGHQSWPARGRHRVLPRRLRDLYDAHGRKVSLIGWSLGGIYAREVAKVYPDAVRQVITLGTPFTGHPKATNAWRLYEFVTGHKIGAPELHEPLRTPPPVPTTSVFSRTDGVVAWQCSVERASPLTDNIEVRQATSAWD